MKNKTIFRILVVALVILIMCAAGFIVWNQYWQGQGTREDFGFMSLRIPNGYTVTKDPVLEAPGVYTGTIKNQDITITYNACRCQRVTGTIDTERFDVSEEVIGGKEATVQNEKADEGALEVHFSDITITSISKKSSLVKRADALVAEIEPVMELKLTVLDATKAERQAALKIIKTAQFPAIPY